MGVLCTDPLQALWISCEYGLSHRLAFSDASKHAAFRNLQRTIADMRWQMARQMTEHDVARSTQAAAADDSPRLRKYDSSITLGAIAHQLSISSKEGRLAYDLRSIIQVCLHTHSAATATTQHVPYTKGGLCA